MTSGPMIDYEMLAQDAMRSIVKTVLTRAAKSGLPGDHHFYIAFDTQAPGTSVSRRLKEKYPEEMMIVLQHRFWDLVVSEDRFEVKLTFDGIPERLVVPFTAIRVFFDPSVRYTLQFDEARSAEPSEDGSARNLAPRAVNGGPRRPRTPRKPKTERPGLIGPVDVTPPTAGAGPTLLEPPNGEGSGAPAAAGDTEPTPPPADLPASGAQVLRLDQFRKK